MDDAYPSSAFRDLLRARGVRFILSADAHSAEALDCAFDRFGAAEPTLDAASPLGMSLARGKIWYNHQT